VIVAEAGGGLVVIGAVRGHVADVAPLLERLEAIRPRSVGIGLSFDEMTGLVDHFVGRPFEPLVPLTAHETAELVGLVRYGEARVPHPAYVAALGWARERSIPVEALEPNDDQYADLFTRHISYLELVRRTLRERRLARRPPAGATADEYAVTWDRALGPGAGSRAFVAAREATVAAGARRLASRGGPVALVVDRERFDGVVAAIRAG